MCIVLKRVRRSRRTKGWEYGWECVREEICGYVEDRVHYMDIQT